MSGSGPPIVALLQIKLSLFSCSLTSSVALSNTGSTLNMCQLRPITGSSYGGGANCTRVLADT